MQTAHLNADNIAADWVRDRHASQLCTEHLWPNTRSSISVGAMRIGKRGRSRFSALPNPSVPLALLETGLTWPVRSSPIPAQNYSYGRQYNTFRCLVSNSASGRNVQILYNIMYVYITLVGSHLHWFTPRDSRSAAWAKGPICISHKPPISIDVHNSHLLRDLYLL